MWRSRQSPVPEDAPRVGADFPEPASADPVLEYRLRAALIESRQRYKDLVEISSDFAWETRTDGSFAFVSPRGALGYRAAELVDRPASGFVVDAPKLAVNPFEAQAAVEEVELAFRRSDGAIAILSASAIPRFDDQDRWIGARGVCRDVTEARARDAALAQARHRERLFAVIVAAIRDVVEPANLLATAADAILRAFHAAGCRIFRYASGRGLVLAASAGEPALPPLLEEAFEEAFRGADAAMVEYGRALVAVTRHRREANGALYLWRADADGPWDVDAVALAGAVAGQLGIAIEQIANHEVLERLTRTDPLTGLLNRRGFLDQLERRLARHARAALSAERVEAALIYVDLDNFKPVNDRFGHQKGDDLLVHVAELLRQGTRAADLVARLGGDEFALWLEGVDEAGARIRAGVLLELSEALAPFSADAGRPLGLSIGIALYDPESGEGVNSLTARADAAMYAVKRGGKRNICVAVAARSAEA
ncbi:MAG TPA: sensor domain-containing diguanylate cyclase [Alphaproteobacteria bacterium]|nr:sensor domain-containing diguanylate cyclase [Alphaproteobacteria bacterium]